MKIRSVAVLFCLVCATAAAEGPEQKIVEDGAAQVPAPASAPAVGEASEGDSPAAPDVAKTPVQLLPYFDGTLTRVRGVDTVEIDGERMRLVGITGPRKWWWGAVRDCYADDAAMYLEAFVLNKEVQYAFDPMIGPDNKRGYRRIYLVSEGELINARLIEDGKAMADRSKDYLERERFFDLEDMAHLHQVGLWHVCPVECARGKVCRVKNW